MRRARLRPRDEPGYTVVELLVSMAILGIVLGGLASVFVSGGRAYDEAANRVKAQQNAVLALNKLRREIQCAKALSGPSVGVPASRATLTLGTSCPTAGGGATVTWCAKPTTPASTTRYTLWRYPSAWSGSCNPSGTPGALPYADYLTTAEVFTGYTPQSATSLGFVGVDLRVDVTPATPQQRFELVDTLVLHNSCRAAGAC